MDRRVIIPLLGAAAVIFACGPLPRFGAAPHAGTKRVHELAERRSGGRTVARHRDVGDGPVEGSLGIEMADGVRFALAVVNATDHRVELNFPDGRTRDFAVYDDAGREVWRASRGRLYTQMVQNKLLSAGDTVVYEARWAAPTPGRYHVMAELRSADHPIVRESSFEVVAAGAPHAQVAAQR